MKKRSSDEIFIETLLELAKNEPVDRITVKSIVEKSGLSTQTFYNHFDDKYDLIQWVHRSESNRLMKKIEDEEDYTYRNFIVDNLQFFMDHRDFMENALKNTSGYDSYAIHYAESGYEMWNGYITKKFGIDKLPEDIDIYLRMYCHVCMRMMEEWIMKMDYIPAKDFAGYIWEMTPVKLRPYFEET